jgi:phosphoglycolate phosphatase-like HAD superfamily hydrolase
VDPVQATRFLPGTGIEVIRERPDGPPPRHVLFDFDGTLSLIREGWPAVMSQMMVEALQATGTAESAERLREVALGFIMELNGKQTIYQMIRLAEEIRARGGQPEEPLVYKQRYHERLMEKIDYRRAALRAGELAPEALLVPHALELLDALAGRGATLYLASGTDEQYVMEEVRLLGLDRYFGPRVYGAIDDYKAFSKQMVIERILRENRIDGRLLLGFGDGYVEIENVKSSGGTAVAVASDEAGRSGRPDPWKRDRLIGVGADVVIADYRDWAPLLRYLWREA